jgi:hypothetical protein
MQSVLICRCRQAAAACLAVACLVALALIACGPASAQNLFGGRQVEVTLSGKDGTAMAGAAVRVFAPGESARAAATGKTDSSGKFYFTADRDGFWTAEAKNGGEVARVVVKVSGLDAGSEPLSPWLLLAGLAVLLVIALIFRILRARIRARRPPQG